MLTNCLVEVFRCSLHIIFLWRATDIRLFKTYGPLCLRHVSLLRTLRSRHKAQNKQRTLSETDSMPLSKVWSGYQSHPPPASYPIAIENYNYNRLDSVCLCNILGPLSLYCNIGIDSCSELSTIEPVVALYFKGLGKEHEQIVNNLCMQTQYKRSFPRGLTGTGKYIGGVVR